MKNLAQLRTELPELEGLSDGDAVDVLHQAYYPDLPIEEVAKSLGYTPQVAADPATGAPAERSWGQALTDTGRGLMAGGASLVKGAGDLYGLVSGDMENPVSELGGNAVEYWNEGLSPQLKARQAERAAKMADADGLLAKAGTGFVETISDPMLLLDGVAQSAASFVPGMAAGRLASGASMAGAMARGPLTEAASAAAAQAAGRLGTGVAIGTGAVQQGASVAGDTYDRSLQTAAEELASHPDFQARVQAGEDPAAVFRDMATGAARASFGPATAISALLNALPGGSAIERALVGGAARGAGGGVLKSTAKSALGETFSEGGEEGGGALAGNVARQAYVDPSADLTENVGENAGVGAATGMAMGGAVGPLHSGDPAPVAPSPAPPGAGPLTRAAAAGAAAMATAAGAAGQPPAAPPAPQPNGDIVGPNGTVFKRQPDGSLVAAPPAPTMAGNPEPGSGLSDAEDPFAAGNLIAPGVPDLERTQPMVARPEVDPFTAPDVDPSAPAANEGANASQSAPGSAFEQRERDRPKGEEALTDPLPGDQTTAAGAPFKTMGAALGALNRAGGEAAGDIVRVKGGLVIRPKGSADGGLGVSAVGGSAGGGAEPGAVDVGGVAADGRAPADGVEPPVAGGTVAAGGADPVLEGRGGEQGGALNVQDPPSAQPAAQAAGAETSPAGEGAAGAAGAADPVAGAAPVQAAGLTPAPSTVAPSTKEVEGGGLTRVQVGPNADSFTNVNAQAARDQSDRLGLTQEIEDAFAEGLTVRQVGARLAAAGRLDRIPKEDREGFLIGTRATLGIPSRGDADGQAEFEQWRAARAARAGAGPVPETAGTERAPAGPALSASPAPGANEAVTPVAESTAPALAETAEEGGAAPASQPQAQGDAASTSEPNPAPAQAESTAPAPASEVVEHVTAKGKTIRGVWRDDFTERQAKEIDPYSFNAKGKGWFIREKHLGQLPPKGEPLLGPRERREQAIADRQQAAAPAPEGSSKPEESSKTPSFVTVTPAGPGAFAITIDPSAGRPRPSANVIVTDEAAEKARAVLRAKLRGQLNSGLDPEVLQAGITLTLYHLEKGARTFAAYAKAMLDDMGDMVRPHLKSWYLAAKFDPRAAALDGLDSAGSVESAEVPASQPEPETAAAPAEPASQPNPAADLTGHFLAEIKAGRMPKDNPALKKLVEAFDGKPADPARMKVAQEHLEAAIVARARDLVKIAPINGNRATFDKLLELYRSQPNLNVRTSTSIANQAYSTPAPLAFLASRLAGITSESKVLEPTAGTGMLVIGAKPANVHANEIEPTRQGLLLDQGFDVTRRDATAPGLAKAGSMDAVIANPPFGPLDKEERVDGFKINQIDHLIAARALEAMKADGSATLILGASKEPGGLGAGERFFFNWLYGNYNVTGHFEVEGDLYARQGAGWPVRVITINGRIRSSRLAPEAGTIQRATTWEQVYEQFEQALAAGRQTERGPTIGTVSTGANERADGRGAAPAAAGEPTAPAGQRNGAERPAEPAGQPGAGGGRSDARSERDGQRADDDGQPQQPAQPDRLEPAGTGSAEPRERKPARDPGAAALASPEQVDSFQAKYVARSRRKDEDVLIPVNMAGPLQEAMSTLEDAVGDIDEFAAKELGYDSVEQMLDALDDGEYGDKGFMGLQVDAVAAAIYQIKERGKGIVIADQTGIGKGRQAAAIIRWALRNGHVPIFMSVKPQLFTDMYGDLRDIGSSDVKPFIVNRDQWVAGEGNERLFTNPSQALHARRLDAIADSGKLPDGANAVFLTYSQINQSNRQQRAIMALADRAVFVLDESHNAGGASATGDFVKGAIAPAKGTVYLSATYAKRPDNMPLYFKTDLGDAMDEGSLEAAMAAGGLPLQTVVSAGLVKAGQLFRRERSYAGISIDTVTDVARREHHRKLSDATTAALRDILAADRAFHTTFFKELERRYKEAAKGERAMQGGGNKASTTVQHTEFSSVVHNFIRQMLLGMTAQSAAEKAVALLKAGERPLIAFENTMGSFLAEYARANGLKDGDALGTYDYRNVLSRALARSRVYKIQKPNGDEELVTVPLSDLDPVSLVAYQRAQETIDALRIDLPASPVDWIRAEVAKAGFKAKEITGRSLLVDYSDPKAPKLGALDKEESEDKVLTTRQFNGGQLDVILLNVSGSTGISLHAAHKFANKTKRHMIVAQAAQDINIFMQMLGRVNRTGQAVKPAYTILQPDLPAVLRPQAVLSKKMQSLNANTSSNTESATSVQAVDFLNKYGDKVVHEYLQDNPKLVGALWLGDIGTEPEEDLARKATGRLATQPVAVQEQFYEEVSANYNSLIDYLNKTNQNELVPRTFDFDAKELKSQVLYEGEDQNTPFGADAIYGEYSIKAQGKAMTPQEIHAAMQHSLEAAGATGGGVHVKELVDKLEASFHPWANTLPEDMRAEIETKRRDGMEFLRSHPIGTMVRVEINEEPYEAVILNIRSTYKGQGNPFALSKVQVTVAVNGALRQVTVPGSQFTKIETSNNGRDDYRMKRIFSERRENDRETAKIATGNLLAAFGEIKTSGRIISFTKADGTVEQGILLPKKFELTEHTDQSYRLRTAEQALRFLGESANELTAKWGLNSRDRVVKVTPDRGGIKIAVPKSKAKGGKFFLDPQLLEHTGDFVSVGEKMVVHVYERAKAIAALERLMSKAALYVPQSMAEEARSKLPPAESLSVSDTTPAGGDNEMSSPQNVGDGEPSATDRERAAKLAERLERAYPGRVFHAVAAPTGRGRRSGSTAGAAAWVAKRLFGHDAVWVRFADRAKPLFNGAFSATIPDAIFLNADADQPHLAVLGHELLHRLRRERPDLYAQLQTRLGRVLKDVDTFRDALAQRYQEQGGYPLPDNWLEELHADVVGDFFVDPEFWRAMGERQPGLFRRVAAAVMRFLEQVRAALTGAAERPFGTDRFLADIDAARAAVAEAMGEFSKGEGAPVHQAGESLSVAGKSLEDLYRAYRAADDAAGDDAELSTPAQKAAKTRAYKALYAAAEKEGNPASVIHRLARRFDYPEESQAGGPSESLDIASRLAQTDTPAFKRWFGNSKLTDDDGQPQVFYHATTRDFTEFKAGGADPTLSGHAIWLSPHATHQAAAHNIGGGSRGFREGTRVMPVYVRMQRPLVIDDKATLEWAREVFAGGSKEFPQLMPKKWADEVTRDGEYDGIVFDGPALGWGDNSGEIVVFDPKQIKSAIGNRGTFDPQSPDVSLSIASAIRLNSVREARLPAGYMVDDFIRSHGTLSWWQKSVGTPFHLAKQSTPFRRVFDSVQRFLGDVSHYANAAGDMAPTILPKLEHLKDILRRPLDAGDRKAIAAPIFEGTLAWARDASGKPVRVADLAEAAEGMDVHEKAHRLLKDKHVTPEVLRMWQGLPMEQFEAIIEGKYERDVLKAGVVWTPAELRQHFNLNDAQVKLYQEFRAAVDRSLNDLATSDMVRTMGKEAPADLREKALAAKTGAEAAALLQAHLDAQLQEDIDQARRDELNALAAKLVEKRDRLKDLVERGYAPLMRFGTHVVDVVQGGERKSFGLYESQAEANRAARRARAAFPDAEIKRGTTSEEAYKQFAGVSPETLELFGEMLGLDSDGEGDASRAFQTYLRVARSNRDSMKRLIRRKGVAGFNDDVARVLAGFVTSNARRTSANLHTGEIETSLREIPQGEGQLRDYAGRLVDYVRNPQEEAQGLRALMFAQFLGGSVASAAVNLTQPLTMTIPYLSQFGGGKKAAAQVLRAWADLRRGSTGDAALDKALHQAEEDGIVAPQEIHHLQAQASGRGALMGGDGTLGGEAAAKLGNGWTRLALAWGRMFGFAEQINRRATFIAAYRIALEQGRGDPVAFASEAVNQTQGVYNKGNKPRWARGAAGSVLMTFKQFSVSYLELFGRMWGNGRDGKIAAALMLLTLLALSGMDELPFMEDAEDIIDGIAQRVFGRDFSAKQWRHQVAERVIGKTGAELLAKGLSGIPGMPMDVSGRLGMGDLLPGTGFALKKQDYGRDFESLAGPVADLAKRGAAAVGKALQGDVLGAGEQLLPVAARNAIQGVRMARTGQYEDRTGKKVIETTTGEALLKGIGFQPNNVARVQEATGAVQRSIGLVKIEEGEIADQWAKAIAARDAEGIAEARQRLKDWNRSNPDSRISIKIPQLRQRVKKLRQSKAERLAATAPKEIRARVRRELEGER